MRSTLSQSTLTLALLALAANLPLRASAHGYVKQVAIDGKFFAGNVPGAPASIQIASPIRLVAHAEPVHGATTDAVNCGNGSVPAALVADALPGSLVTFDWTSESPGINWPHNTGPIMTYMASCGNVTCDKFNALDAQWFKIDEAGRQPDNATWWQADIMQGLTHTLAIPNLTPGNYMIRTEILALQLAQTKLGAEFYPSCTQLRIGGNGNASAPASALVKLPGAYSDSDPGIFDPHSLAFTPGSNYTFPGPAVDPTVSAGGSFITAPANATVSGRAGEAANAKIAAAMSKRDHVPRRVSRIMRRSMMSFNDEGPRVEDIAW